MTALIAEDTWRKGQRCSEPGCEEKFDYRQEFIVHNSYHEYHKKIKEIGRQELKLLESKYNAQIKCPLADEISEEDYYYFPQLPTRLICEWYECGMEFLSVEKFYEHVSNHAHRLVDRCYWENCNKILKTITLQQWREHLRVHTLQKLYACPQCGNFFTNKIKFDDHFLRHLPLPRFLENLHDLEYPPVITSKKAGEHLFDIEEYLIDHNKVKIFRCTYIDCSKAFLTSSLLREHIRIHSNKNQCDQCSYVAKSLSRLENHKLYRHQTERKYCCTICPKTFKLRGDLRAHVRRHQIVEPYKCDKCDFETMTVEGLRTHLKLHYEFQEYVCHICERVFNRGNNLSRHLKDKHKLSLPNGQSRFRYSLMDDGDKKYYMICPEQDAETAETAAAARAALAKETTVVAAAVTINNNINNPTSD